MIHSGSRGLGHQVATDALVLMEAAMARDKIDINDRQLACAKISSQASRDVTAELARSAAILSISFEKFVILALLLRIYL